MTLESSGDGWKKKPGLLILTVTWSVRKYVWGCGCRYACVYKYIFRYSCSPYIRLLSYRRAAVIWHETTFLVNTYGKIYNWKIKKRLSFFKNQRPSQVTTCLLFVHRHRRLRYLGHPSWAHVTRERSVFARVTLPLVATRTTSISWLITAQEGENSSRRTMASIRISNLSERVSGAGWNLRPVVISVYLK